MCLAIPMKIVSVNGNQGVAESGGILKSIDISLVPEVCVGEYVIVHAGFAIERMNEREAQKTLAVFQDLIHLMEADTQ